MSPEQAQADKRSVGTLHYTAGGLVLLFFWLLMGDFAIYMRERSAIPSVNELLRQQGASATVMSLLVYTLPAIIGMILGPIASYRSDRHRSPRGRRIPFLIVPTPIGAVAMVGVGLSPWLGAHIHAWLGSHSPGQSFCVLSVFFVCWTLFECAAIVTLNIFTALINDVVPKGLLGRFYGAFRIISLGAGIVFNYWILQLTETHLFEIFLGVGLLFGAGFTLMCLMVKEGEYPPPPAEEAEGGRPVGFIANARVYFVECFSHRYYVVIFMAIMLTRMAFVPFNSFSQWYADSLGMPKATLGMLTAASFGGSVVLAMFIGWLVDRVGAMRMSLITMSLYVVATALGFVLTHDAFSFGVFYVIHVVMAGAYITAAASLPMVLFPRLRFSQFDSAGILVIAIANATLGLIQGPILDFSGKTLSVGAGLSVVAATVGESDTILVAQVERALTETIPRLAVVALLQPQAQGGPQVFYIVFINLQVGMPGHAEL